jgi:predicted ester cyclase
MPRGGEDLAHERRAGLLIAHAVDGTALAALLRDCEAVTGDDHRRLYERWLFELWHGDEGVAAQIVTPGFVIHQARGEPGASEAVRGPQAAVELVRMGRSPFSELTFALEVGPIVERDLLAARWTGRGAYAGGIPGASAPAGTEVSFGGIDIMRIEDGRLAEYWVSSDGLALMGQLGALG